MWTYLNSDHLYSEAGIRLCCFVGVLVTMAGWEFLAPRRGLSTSKLLRWTSHFGLSVINVVALRLLIPLGAIGVALAAEAHRWGLFYHFSLPDWLACLICLLALDFAIYLQHRLFHAVPVLWRLHMVHHADLDFDVTTGLRFHTIEILLSFGMKCVSIVLLGALPVAVLVFEVMLNATAMFNHSNIRLPLALDRLLRTIVVTPDMHRVHHSAIKREANSNFGFNLPWWDFLLGTYRGQPDGGHERMMIGLSQFRDDRVERLPQMLALPFTDKVESNSIKQDNGEPESQSSSPR